MVNLRGVQPSRRSSSSAKIFGDRRHVPKDGGRPAIAPGDRHRANLQDPIGCLLLGRSLRAYSVVAVPVIAYLPWAFRSHCSQHGRPPGYLPRWDRQEVSLHTLHAFTAAALNA
jgi:hypothetical protein